MFYIIDNGAAYPEFHVTLIVEAPESFEEWFNKTLCPTVKESHRKDPLRYRCEDPFVIAKSPSLTICASEAINADQLIQELLPSAPLPPAYQEK